MLGPSPYGGALILCANKAYGFDEKHRNHVALFKHMFGGGRLHEAVRGSNSLEGVVRALEGFPLMGRSWPIKRPWA